MPGRFLMVVLLALSTPALAANELPRRKSGLWSMSMTLPGLSIPMTMQQCVDEKTDDMTVTMADNSKQACRSQSKRDGNRIVFDLTCKFGKTTSTTRGVFVGDPKSSYTFESTTTFNPPTPGMRDGVTKATAQWIGPCRAGMKPGDVVMSNGVKFNVNDRTAQRK
ncbi:MAG TPA: DUF3617 family protein [Burkholderiaceae bacterium]|nr:DUF3617 family protein [Burkholderiaceae bacterium]